MLLGGLRYLLPAILAAHKQGYYVITCDYLPENIAHKYSDEYINASIIDKDAILNIAKKMEIDGILSFAVDPGVITAAYVQEKMGLPSFGPYDSIVILQNKDKFRKFLAENGFNVPKAKSFQSIEEAMSNLSWYEYPVIVKPTDSAGSRGVKRVNEETELKDALLNAFNNSFSGHVIVEEFIEKRGCSSDTDSFSVDGQLKFVSFSAQRFDDQATNPYTPSAYSWPSTFSLDEEMFLVSELQRLLSLLKMNTCLYNIETRVGTNGKPYIMEVTPRAGGNRLAEMIRYATGVDMISASVRSAVGDPVIGVEQKPYNGHWAEVILHSDCDGRFDHLEIDSSLCAQIIEEDIWVNKGDMVESFIGANKAIGTLILRFEKEGELLAALAAINKWLKVVVY